MAPNTSSAVWGREIKRKQKTSEPDRISHHPWSYGLSQPQVFWGLRSCLRVKGHVDKLRPSEPTRKIRLSAGQSCSLFSMLFLINWKSKSYPTKFNHVYGIVDKRSSVYLKNCVALSYFFVLLYYLDFIHYFAHFLKFTYTHTERHTQITFINKLLGFIHCIHYIFTALSLHGLFFCSPHPGLGSLAWGWLQ